MAEDKPPAKRPASSAPKASSSPPKGGATGGATAIRWARGIALLGAGLAALIGLTAAFGVVTDILVLRGIVALVLMIGIPLFVSDKVLSRMKSGLGGSERLGIVLDVFGVFWMALAWLFVGALPRVFVAEGDRQTRNGSISFAKATYLLGGVSPTFRMERSLVAAASSSVSTPGGGNAGSGPAATDASPPQGDR